MKINKAGHLTDESGKEQMCPLTRLEEWCTARCALFDYRPKVVGMNIGGVGILALRCCPSPYPTPITHDARPKEGGGE